MSITYSGRVILTHARSLHALVAARSLGRHNLDVIGCDDVPLMAMSFSRYATDTFLHPEKSAPDFLDRFLEEIASRKPAAGLPYVVMPVHASTRFLARHRNAIEQHALLAAPQYDAINQIDPKDNLATTIAGLDIPAPRTRFFSKGDDARQCAKEFDYPAIVKLSDGTASVGQAKVDSAEEFVEHIQMIEDQQLWQNERPVLVQELVPGADYCVTSIFDHGQLRGSMVYRNLRTFPPEQGFGVLRETVEAPALIEVSEQLLGPLEWNGIAQVDFRWNGPGSTPYLIEVNPRFWGGLFQSVESGIDYPWLLYQLTVNGHIDTAPPPQIGVQTKVPFIGFLSAILETVEDPTHYKRLTRAWLETCEDIKKGHVLEGLQQLSVGIGDYVDVPDRLKAISSWMQEARHAKSEIFSTDDPTTSLGILYILGSLLRSGQLPEEISRSARTPAPADES